MNASAIVARFFMMFSERWQWPKAVYLCELEQGNAMGLPQWDPTDPRDAQVGGCWGVQLAFRSAAVISMRL